MCDDTSSYNNEENVFKRFTKKKKKNARFLRNAKGFAKQGIYGRGERIEDEEFQYFINILDTIKKGFEDVEDKVMMANNVFKQTDSKETRLACNQIVCKALESLIAYVDADILERYFKAFSENFRPLCSDRFASHVLQKMVEIAFLRSVKRIDDIKQPDTKKVKLNANDNLKEDVYNTTTIFPSEHITKCNEFILRISKFLLNNLEDFVWDSCANHIMRTCILCLAGIHIPKVAFEKNSKEFNKNRKDYNVPDEWHEVVKEYAERLQLWPQFVDFPYQEHTSALLGVICLALDVIDKKLLKRLGEKILFDTLYKYHINENYEKNDVSEINSEVKLPKVFQYQSSIILLETLLETAGHKLFNKLYGTIFYGRIAELARSTMANFSVQKLLMRIDEKSVFENIFDELHEHLEELLRIGHTGLVHALTSTCLRLQTKQAQMSTALQNALHVTNEKNLFFLCLLKLKPLEIIKQEENAQFVHLHGSLIIQNLLKFNKPILLVNCLLETPVEQLLWIFNTPNGSHICNAFFESAYIGEKSREKLLRHMEGFYVDLVITKFGSRIVEICFNASQIQQKVKIAKELVSKANMVKGSLFGRTVFHNLRLETFRLSPKQWENSLQQQQQKRQHPNHPNKEIKNHALNSN